MTRYGRSVRNSGIFSLLTKKINKYIKPFPEITFKRRKSIKDTMVASHYVGNKLSQKDKPGTYPCGNCNYCRFLLKGDNVGLPNGTSWTPRHRAFYVGKTKRPFFCRIRDHVSAISKQKMETPISRHMGLYHIQNLTMTGFFALEHISPTWQGWGYWQTIIAAWSEMDLSFTGN